MALAIVCWCVCTWLWTNQSTRWNIYKRLWFRHQIIGHPLKLREMFNGTEWMYACVKWDSSCNKRIYTIVSPYKLYTYVIQCNVHSLSIEIAQRTWMFTTLADYWTLCFRRHCCAKRLYTSVSSTAEFRCGYHRKRLTCGKTRDDGAIFAVRPKHGCAMFSRVRVVHGERTVCGAGLCKRPCQKCLQFF